MKVLHLNDHLASKGGIETYLLSVIPQLAQQGIHSKVVFASGDPTLVSDSEEVPSLGSPRIADRKVARKALKSIISELQPDIVHLHNVQNVGAISACLDAVPCIVTAHDYRYFCPASSFYFRGTKEICNRKCNAGCFVETAKKRCMSPRPLNGWRQYSRVMWMSKHIHRFKRVIAPSEGASSRLVAAGLPASQVSVVPYFCPMEPLDEPRQIPTQQQILFLGRLSENKGWKYFVEALGKLPASIQGKMVGNITPENRTVVMSWADKNGCAERLTLAPWASRSEIVEHYRQASVVVFPSIWDETLGIVGLESLACGVPVVASDVGGVREWLIEGETGRLVPIKNADAIAKAVAELIDSPEVLDQMGTMGQRLIREKFQASVHLEALIRTYGDASHGQIEAPIGDDLANKMFTEGQLQ